MNMLLEIAVDATRILSILCGLIGLAFSLLLLFSPVVTHRVCNMLNRPISVEQSTRYFNAYIAFDSLAHRHHTLVGILIGSGGLFLSYYFWRTLDAHMLAGLIGPVASEFALILGRVTGPLGAGLGVVLALWPSAVMQVEGKVNRWISTESFFNALNRMRFPIDSLVMRHPITFGLGGMTASTALIILSLLQIFNL